MNNFIKSAFIMVMTCLIFLINCPQGKEDEKKADIVPKWGTFQKILESDLKENEYFGYSVAIHGNYAIVGAPKGNNGTGSAYIYKKDISTDEWGNGVKLLASDGAYGDFFGCSVAISEDYAIVGASGDKIGGLTDCGCAYIFHYTGTAPSYSNTWDAGLRIQYPSGSTSGPEQNDKFGHSVGIDGIWAFVGTPGSRSDRGAVYGYKRDISKDNVWGYYCYILANDESTDDKRFGYSVSISGDYLAIGAMNDDDKGTNSGAVYVVKRDNTFNWYDPGAVKLYASDEAEFDYFGYSVSISGSYIVVGACNKTNSDGRGAAYIFHNSGSNSWDTGYKIAPTDLRDGDRLGYSVSISGDYAIVAAYLEDGSGLDRGAAYIYHRTGLNEWNAGIKETEPVPADYNAFGSSVAIYGNDIVIGVQSADGPYTDQGAAYFIH